MPAVMGRCEVQWFSGRVLDLRLRHGWFEPHQRHCIASLSKTIYPLLITGSTLETSPQLLTGMQSINTHTVLPAKSDSDVMFC